MRDLHFEEIVHHWFLITGDVGSGKTALTARVLEDAIETARPGEVTLIDMAPERMIYKGKVVGGRLTDYNMNFNSKLRVLPPGRKLSAPRIEGRTRAEVIRLAKMNADVTTAILDEYIDAPTPILFINDASIHLQTGGVNMIIKAARTAETFFANSYEGTTLLDDQGSGVSSRERRGLAALKEAMDHVLTMKAAAPPSVMI